VNANATAVATVVTISLVVGLPWMVIIFATAAYARRVRSRPSYGMLWGAVGVLATSVLRELLRSLVAVGTIGSSPGADAVDAFGVQTAVVSGVSLVLTLSFGLLFAVSLLIVLREAAGHVSPDALV
jgi:hypothetical protein